MGVFSKIYEKTMKDIENEELKRQNSTESFIQNLCVTTVISSFRWKNIPEMIRQIPYWIEESLFYFGKMAGTLDDEGKFIILPCTRNGNLLPNGLSSQYTLYYRNGKTLVRNLEEIELLYDNWSEIPSVLFTSDIAEKMANALRAVDSALERAKVPPIIFSQKEELTNIIINALNDSYQNKKPFAVANISNAVKAFIEKISMYDDKEVGIINLWDIFVRYKNLFFTTNGVNNVEISKQERLTMAEGSSNTEITRYGVFFDKYDHRRDFIERVKEHFGYELEIEINRNRDAVTDLSMDNKEKIEMENKMIAPYADKVEEKEEKDDGNEDGKMEDSERD